MKILLFLALIPMTCLAQGHLTIPENEQDPETEEILIKKPEKYLRDESMIYDLDTDLGIKDQRRYTGTDHNRISFSGHLSGDYEHVDNVLGLDFTYMHRSNRFNKIWYGFQFFQHQTYFDAITKNQPVETGDDANDESQFVRPGHTKNTVMAAGLGVSYRFKLLLDFWRTEDVFENIDVFVNAVQLNETFIKQTYKGWGLTTSYGLHKRSSTRFFYGGKATYNLAAVTRKQLGTESKGDRSLALGWLSLALEMGFFF